MVGQISNGVKKILYLVTQSDSGGAQRYIFDLATHLNSNFKIIVAAGENPNGELFQRLESKNIANHYLKHLKRQINPFYDFLAFFELRNLIKKEKPDIIHLNSSKVSILGSLAAKLFIVRCSLFVVYTVHGWVFNEPLPWLIKNIYLWLEKWTARFKDKIICVSEYDRQVALKHSFPKEKLITIHNGIDLDKLEFLEKDKAKVMLYRLKPELQTTKKPEPQTTKKPELQKSTGVHSLECKNGVHSLGCKNGVHSLGCKNGVHSLECKLIGSIANLYPTKGIEYLIETVKILNTKYQIRNTRYIIIGEGRERPKLEKLIKKYHLENIFFLLGYIPNASRYLKAFDIFVLPSVKEGLPYTILEAMAAGLPIVATKVGGVPEMITLPPPPLKKGGAGGVATGFLVQPKNSQELAEKIIYLLQNPEIAKNLGQQAQSKVKEEFFLEKMVKETEKIYSGV